MKLAVLSDTSHTSQRFIAHALHYGYKVVVLSARRIIPSSHNHNLTTIIGSADNQRDIEQTLQDTHAVVDTSGTICDAARIDTIITGMYAAGLQRLLITTDGLRHRAQSLYEPYIIRTLQKTSLDWTLIHSLSDAEPNRNHLNNTVAADNFAEFTISQITDVNYLRSAITLRV